MSKVPQHKYSTTKTETTPATNQEKWRSCLGLDAQAAKHSTPEDNPVSTDGRASIKKISKSGYESKKTIIITRCLCEPCPLFYTDTISGSILIKCRDPRHTLIEM